MANAADETDCTAIDSNAEWIDDTTSANTSDKCSLWGGSWSDPNCTDGGSTTDACWSAGTTTTALQGCYESDNDTLNTDEDCFAGSDHTGDEGSIIEGVCISAS